MVSWVVFLFQGIRWAAQHLAMPFGSISAVQAWHRTGAFLLAAVRRLARAPAARYVDDFFGASRKGVYWTGGRCLDVLARLAGFPCAGEKSVDQVATMVILGAQVAAEFLEGAVTLLVDDLKAERWSRVLER